MNLESCHGSQLSGFRVWGCSESGSSKTGVVWCTLAKPTTGIGQSSDQGHDLVYANSWMCTLKMDVYTRDCLTVFFGKTMVMLCFPKFPCEH